MGVYVASLVYYVVLAAMIVVGAYVVVRVASIAHFRTKFEHFMRVKRETGEDDGKGTS